MEEKKQNENKSLDEKETTKVSGGYSGGYCAQSPDRTCHVEAVGKWSPGNEICDTCGWRAW